MVGMFALYSDKRSLDPSVVFIFSGNICCLERIHKIISLYFNLTKKLISHELPLTYLNWTRSFLVLPFVLALICLKVWKPSSQSIKIWYFRSSNFWAINSSTEVCRSQQQQPSKSRYAWNDNLLKISPVRIIQAKQGAPPQTPASSQWYKTFLGN